MGGRVAWGRYEGNDVEAVVAMLLNREHPDSIRITPSRGDGGVDILDAGAAGDGGDVVYQVKRYTSPLNSTQKTKVERSLTRLLDPEHGDPRWQHLKVTEWRLVTPWDPSPEAYVWLTDFAAHFGLRTKWDGLTHVDQLAAKYPDVIDYYLLDGKSAVQNAYREAMALMSLDRTDVGTMSVAEVTGRVATALRTLDKDPHYVYESRFGHGEPAAPGPRSRLVLSWYRIDPSAGTWQAVDVLARCAESVIERPITINGLLTVDTGSNFETALKDFHDFGTPFTSPEGAYSGVIDAPGGLGGSIVKATIVAGSVGDDVGDDVELRLVVLNPAGETIAEADVDRVGRSRGTAGVRIVLREVNGVFDLVQRVNVADLAIAASFTLLPIEGRPVATIRGPIQFLAAFRRPNRWHISVRHARGKIVDGNDIPELVDPPIAEWLDTVADLIDLLSHLQDHADAVIKVPDFEAYALDQHRDWRFVGKILSGETVVLTVPDGHAFDVVGARGTTAPRGSFGLVLPLRTKVGDQTLDFGTVQASFTDPELVEQAMTKDGHPVFRYTTPDRSVSYTLHNESS